MVVDYFLGLDREALQRMGADPEKLLARNDWLALLRSDHAKPLRERNFYYLGYELAGRLIGHTNVNQIVFGEEATLHLHIYPSESRRRGLGTAMVRAAIPRFFADLELKRLHCWPRASNDAPNRTLAKLGFRSLGRLTTVPGWINFEQEVERWVLEREALSQLASDESGEQEHGLAAR